MARYGPEHKQETRRRLIATAGRRLKADGIDGSGIATLVADAGLTNGAFYGHFDSKSDLVASVVAEQFADQVSAIEALPAGPEAVAAYLGDYLSPTHRDDLAGGCPSAALLDEIARGDLATREAYTSGYSAVTEAIAQRLDGDVDRATTLMGLIVGSMQSARAVTDPVLSERILAAAYAQALAIVGAPSDPTDRDAR